MKGSGFSHGKTNKHQGDDSWRPATPGTKSKVGLKSSPTVQNKIIPILNLSPQFSHAGKTSRIFGLLIKLQRTKSTQHNRSAKNTHLKTRAEQLNQLKHFTFKWLFFPPTTPSKKTILYSCLYRKHAPFGNNLPLFLKKIPFFPG